MCVCVRVTLQLKHLHMLTNMRFLCTAKVQSKVAMLCNDARQVFHGYPSELSGGGRVYTQKISVFTTHL